MNISSINRENFFESLITLGTETRTESKEIKKEGEMKDLKRVIPTLQKTKTNIKFVLKKPPLTTQTY